MEKCPKCLFVNNFNELNGHLMCMSCGEWFEPDGTPTFCESGLETGYMDKTEPLIVNSIEITAGSIGGKLAKPVKNAWKNGGIGADGDMMFNVELDNGIIVFVKLEILKST